MTLSDCNDLKKAQKELLLAIFNRENIVLLLNNRFYHRHNDTKVYTAHGILAAKFFSPVIPSELEKVESVLRNKGKTFERKRVRILIEDF
jgi:hypothetical protein